MIKEEGIGVGKARGWMYRRNGRIEGESGVIEGWGEGEG